MSTRTAFAQWLSVGPPRLVALLLTLSLGVLGGAPPALADIVNAPTTFAVLDASDGTVDGVYSVAGDLTITGTGSITCNDPAAPPAAGACAIQIAVTGSVFMQAGSAILAENTVGPGNGARIEVTAGGDFQMASGSKISSSKTTPAGNGNAGNITLNIGDPGALPPTGDFTMAPGAQILANSPNHRGGDITINVARSAQVGGLVESFGGQGGTGGNLPRGGGRITIDAGCNLTVSGKVSSRGRDPGADLVHLEGGCDVIIIGLVESTGVGHGIPKNPPNSCNAAFRPDKPANSTACVECGPAIRSSSTAPAPEGRGQRRHRRDGWVQRDVVDRPLRARPHPDRRRHRRAVRGARQWHRRQLQRQRRRRSRSSPPTASVLMQNLALQTDATVRAVAEACPRPGGRPGQPRHALIFARGDFVALGGFGFGGTVEVTSFAGSLSWQNGVGDVRPTGDDTVPPFNDDPPVARRGEILFFNCDTGTVTTTGTSFLHNGDTETTPTTVATGEACGGNPTLQAYVELSRLPVRRSGAGALHRGDQDLHERHLARRADRVLRDRPQLRHREPGRRDGHRRQRHAGQPPGRRRRLRAGHSRAGGVAALQRGVHAARQPVHQRRDRQGHRRRHDHVEVTDTAESTCDGARGELPGAMRAARRATGRGSQHFDSWVPTGFDHPADEDRLHESSTTVCTSLGNETLLQSLQGRGGSTFCDKVEMLCARPWRRRSTRSTPAWTTRARWPRSRRAVNAAINSGNATTVDHPGDGARRRQQPGVPAELGGRPEPDPEAGGVDVFALPASDRSFARALLRAHRRGPRLTLYWWPGRGRGTLDPHPGEHACASPRRP